MPEPPFLDPIHKVRSLAQGYAQQLLLELLEVDATPWPEVVALLQAGWSVRVSVGPSEPGAGVAGLSDTDREVVAFLARLQRPLPAAGLKRAMERHNEKPYALITLKRSLRKLKALGFVGNSCNAPRGYFLRENLALWRRPAGAGAADDPGMIPNRRTHPAPAA
jgi:hypothetical protein